MFCTMTLQKQRQTPVQKQTPITANKRIITNKQTNNKGKIHTTTSIKVVTDSVLNKKKSQYSQQSTSINDIIQQKITI